MKLEARKVFYPGQVLLLGASNPLKDLKSILEFEQNMLFVAIVIKTNDTHVNIKEIKYHSGEGHTGVLRNYNELYNFREFEVASDEFSFTLLKDEINAMIEKASHMIGTLSLKWEKYNIPFPKINANTKGIDRIVNLLILNKSIYETHSEFVRNKFTFTKESRRIVLRCHAMNCNHTNKDRLRAMVRSDIASLISATAIERKCINKYLSLTNTDKIDLIQDKLDELH